MKNNINCADAINAIQKINLFDHARSVDEHSAIRSFRRAVINLLLDHKASEDFKKKCADQGNPFIEQPKRNTEELLCFEGMDGPVPGEVHDCSTGFSVIDKTNDIEIGDAYICFWCGEFTESENRVCKKCVSRE